MSKLIYIAAALGLAVAPACKSTSRHNADKAADRVVDKSDKLDDRVNDQAKAIDKETTETARKAADHAAASSDFEVHRSTRVRELRFERDVIGSQPTVMTTLASVLPLTVAGREDVDEKIRILTMRVDEAGNVLNELATIGADGFTAKDDQAADVMKRLNEARSDAWKALDKAPRTDRSS
jgi:hypothetical protein